GALLDGVEDVVDELVRDDDLDLDLGHEVDDVRRPSVHLFLAAGAPEALHLGDGHPLYADLGEGVFHFVELERLDDGFDLLHRRGISTVSAIPRAALGREGGRAGGRERRQPRDESPPGADMQASAYGLAGKDFDSVSERPAR